MRNTKAQYIARTLPLWLVVALASASGQERPLIAPSPMTDQEIDRFVANWRANGAETGASSAGIDVEIAAILERRDELTTFRDSDIRAVFPEVSAADELSYHCHIALSDPQRHTIAYRSEVIDVNRVRVKYLECDLKSGGLSCQIQSQVAYYLGDPSRYFSVGSGVDREVALKVIQLYERDGHDIVDLNSVDREGDAYVLGFGRRGCACHTKRVVRLRSLFLLWEWLDVDDVTTGVCA